MPLAHPLTRIEYQSKEELVDVIANDLEIISVRRGELAEDEAILIEAINLIAGETDKQVGTINVLGVSKKVKIKREKKVSYEKERGKLHPLSILADAYECIKSRIRKSTPVVAERGKQIDELIERVVRGDFSSDTQEFMAVQEIIKIRKCSPVVKIVGIADAKAVIPDDEEMDESL